MTPSVRFSIFVAILAASVSCGSDFGEPAAAAGSGATGSPGSGGSGGSLPAGSGSADQPASGTGPGNGGTGASAGGGSTGVGGTTAGAGATPVGGSGGDSAGASGAENGGGGGATAGSTGAGGSVGGAAGGAAPDSPRERVPFDDDWRFTKGDPQGTGSTLSYSSARSWVLPTGNPFLGAGAAPAARPQGNLGDGISYTTPGFDDGGWQGVTLPHDYAIAGPYSDSIPATMGHLPSTGAAWYRKTFMLPAEDAGKSLFLDIDGAMSYSMVWVNGQFAGGWPYGYASYRVDITDHALPGQENVIAIRLDNPTPTGSNWDQGSSRWYPGAGLYRNVWLVKTAPVHIGHWGTFITTPQASASSATIDLEVTVDNDSAEAVTVTVETEIIELDAVGNAAATAAATLSAQELQVPAGSSAKANQSGMLSNPKLWGVAPNTPNRYVAVTTLSQGGTLVDAYETTFGVRTLEFNANQGFLLNGEHVKMNGVCNHHDQGALGAAFNVRAEERRFELLGEMGANAIRTSHNPPAPELLDLADRVGFFIMDEAFDVWEQGKTGQDHHLFFPEWHEQDLRAMLRRDRNHPSVVMWSIGNELVEQSSGSEGASLAQSLTAIVHEEDPTGRPTVAGMNSANATDPFPGPIDAVGLNYQGSGVRDGPPEYPDFHSAFPQKFIVGTETVDVYSSRGFYTFPVNSSNEGEPAAGSPGASNNQVSSYDLYHADWSYTPDREFHSQEQYSYVGGEFVWTGFDYLGEPSPYDSSRSAYSGILDLAGFKKDRFYLYQSFWRPDFPMAHILPHWTWSDRMGQVTPVHVYTSGDEAELFLNDVSQGKKQKGQYEYRLRWDDVVYEPGTLRVVAYKNGQEWATESIETAGSAAKLGLSADRTTIAADGKDLAFVTLTVLDANDRPVPRSMNAVTFSVSNSGVLVATDNGDPTDRTVFSSAQRDAFNGMALAIVRAVPGVSSQITVTATASGLTEASVTLTAQ